MTIGITPSQQGGHGRRCCHDIETGVIGTKCSIINTLPASLSYLNFHPLKIVARYREPQL